MERFRQVRREESRDQGEERVKRRRLKSFSLHVRNEPMVESRVGHLYSGTEEWQKHQKKYLFLKKKEEKLQSIALK